MPVSVRVESEASIRKKAGDAVAVELTRVLRAAAPAVRGRVAALCKTLVADTDTANALLTGDLLGELGIPAVREKLDAVLRTVADGVTVSAVPVRYSSNGLSGGLYVGMLRSSYEEVLALSGASYVSRPSGSVIPWLGWLLTEGDRIVVVGYDVDFDLSASEKARSRTGQALMVKGSGWRLPAEHAGTQSDNFLTRAFDVPGVEARLAEIVEGEVASRL